MKGVTRCVVVAVTLAVLTLPGAAGTNLHCSTTEVVIIGSLAANTSSRSDENLEFVIDDVAKTVTFMDGRSLAVTRFDNNWMNVNRDDIFYVLDRVGGEFIIMQRLASGTDRGNVAAKRSDQGRHGRAVVRQIVLRECGH